MISSHGVNVDCLHVYLHFHTFAKKVVGDGNNEGCVEFEVTTTCRTVVADGRSVVYCS